MTDAAPPGSPSELVLDARGLSRHYSLGGVTIPVLDDVSLELRRGESVSIVGSSGSGKTTLIQVLGLLDRPESGSLQLIGEDALGASARRRNQLRNATLGFVFQFYHLVNELDALQNVLLPARIGGWPGSRARCQERARDLLERVGLTKRLRHHPPQLSGGERQRVALARALVNEPAILLCDEPTGNLDPRTSAGVQDLLLSMGDSSRALLVVTHEEAFARRCDRVTRLKDGVLVSDSDPSNDTEQHNDEAPDNDTDSQTPDAASAAGSAEIPTHEDQAAHDRGE